MGEPCGGAVVWGWFLKLDHDCISPSLAVSSLNAESSAIKAPKIPRDLVTYFQSPFWVLVMKHHPTNFFFSFLFFIDKLH